MMITGVLAVLHLLPAQNNQPDNLFLLFADGHRKCFCFQLVWFENEMLVGKDKRNSVVGIVDKVFAMIAANVGQ